MGSAKKYGHRLVGIALLSIVLQFFHGTWSYAASTAPVPLRYAQAYSAMRSVFSLPITIGDRQGFFRREGLSFKIVVPIPGGSDKMIDALHDGSADITHVATPFLIRAVLNGSDAVAVAAEFTNPIYSLMAKPEIKSFADLRGKLVGLADEAGTITLSMRKLFALRGLAADEFRVKIIEGTPARWSCLKRGECDAVPLGQPQDLLAAKEGFHSLGISNEAVPDFLYTVTAVRRSWAEKHKDAMVRYLRGLAASLKFIRDPANRKTVVKTIVQSIEAPPDIAEQTLVLFFEPERGVLPKQGEINLKGLEQVIAFMREAGSLKEALPAAERFADLRYLRMAGIQ
ncbi:MAG TPA: ABC transporter substrate-binding protein [Terriglobales bacterium]|jgi:ABC-type nitrate/sulfonate/bicarbonate transport system substrate-binding protein|nr:ABC transporter substrate-binding protein [Terriglobales bacterium]